MDSRIALQPRSEEHPSELLPYTPVFRSYSPLFNRLKRSIFQALEHDKTDGAARERLSGAVVSAAFAVIRKEESFELSPVECRRALTRMPNSVLASMAWEICAILRQIDGQSDRAAT